MNDIEKRYGLLKHLVFHRCQFVAKSILNPFSINELELNMIAPHEVCDGLAKCLVLQLKTELLKYKDSNYEKPIIINHPLNWWEMLKFQHAPKWFLNMFPVKFRSYEYKVKVDLEALFPDFKYIPKDLGNPLITFSVLPELDNAKP